MYYNDFDTVSFRPPEEEEDLSDLIDPDEGQNDEEDEELNDPEAEEDEEIEDEDEEKKGPGE